MAYNVGLKQLREDTDYYIKKVRSGQVFTVYRRSQPLFNITPVVGDHWEEVIDFTKLQKGGVLLEDLLTRLR